MDLFMVLILVALYFLPSLIGMKQKNVASIFVLNLFLGWTFIGWVIALSWAVKRD